MIQLIEQYEQHLRSAGMSPMHIDNNLHPLRRVMAGGQRIDITDFHAADTIIEALQYNQAKSNGTPVRLAGSSVAAYVHGWRAYLKWCAKQARGTGEDADDEEREIAKRKARDISLLRQALADTLDCMDTKPLSSKRKRHLNHDELEHLFDVAAGPAPRTPVEYRPLNRSLLTVIYYTAARVGEVCQFKVGEIRRADDDWWMLTGIRRKKNGARPIWLPASQIIHWAPACKRLALMARGKDVPMIASLYRMIIVIAKRAGLHCSPHTLRYTRATHLYEARTPRENIMEVIQKVLGHKNISTTEGYVDDKIKRFTPPKEGEG